MTHPFAAHRQTAKEHSRVSHITKGYKSGGAVHHGHRAESEKIVKKAKKADLHAEGAKSKHRADRPQRAKGGKVKKNARTIVNVITGGHPAGGAMPPMPAPPMGVGPAAMGPPPMAAKPPMPMGPPPGAGGMPPGGPPPMPMRAKGGKVRHRDDGGRTQLAGDVVDFPISMQQSDSRRISGMQKPPPTKEPMKVLKGPGAAARGGRIERAKGGGVKSIGIDAGTKVQHTDGKDDGKDIGRRRVVTFWAGGGVKKKDCGGPAQTPTRAKGGMVRYRDSGGSLTVSDGSSDPDNIAAQARADARNSSSPQSTQTNSGVATPLGRTGRERIGANGKISGFAKGGRIEAPDGVAKATKLPGGSGGGEARLAKEHRAERR